MPSTTWNEWLDASEPAQRYADMASLLRAWNAGEDPAEWRIWAETHATQRQRARLAMKASLRD